MKAEKKPREWERKKEEKTVISTTNGNFSALENEPRSYKAETKEEGCITLSRNHEYLNALEVS